MEQRTARIILSTTFFFMLLVIPCAAFQSVTPDTLMQWLEGAQHPDFVFIDIRDTDEVSTIIATDTHRPYHLSWNFGELSNNYLKIAKSTPVLLYCRSANRSGSAASFMEANGFTNVSHLAEGFTAWISKKGPTKSRSFLRDISDFPQPNFTMTSTTAKIQPTKRGANPTVGQSLLVFPRQQTLLTHAFGLNGRYVRNLTPTVSSPLLVRPE